MLKGINPVIYLESYPPAEGFRRITTLQYFPDSYQDLPVQYVFLHFMLKNNTEYGLSLAKKKIRKECSRILTRTEIVRCRRIEHVPDISDHTARTILYDLFSFGRLILKEIEYLNHNREPLFTNPGILPNGESGLISSPVKFITPIWQPRDLESMIF